MAAFDIYIFVLCLIVFIALTAMFTFLISSMVKMQLKIINGGLADDKIINEQQVNAKHKNLVVHFIINRFFPICLTVLLVLIFSLSLCARFSNNQSVTIPIAKVVKSDSMAYTYEKNTYIEENDLNCQFQKFDLIIINPLPKEEELKLYDIVVYESNGYLVIHRIVSIEEPNEEHKERYFLLQGDANQYPDKYPVRYSQMRGIYNGSRIRYVGSFVDFMNSPAGYLCILLVIFAYFISPCIDKKIAKATSLRKELLLFKNDANQISFIETKFSKSLLAEYANSRLLDKIIIKSGKSFKAKGICSPDTYYFSHENKKICFAYVYCYRNGKVLLRVIGDNNIINEFSMLKPTRFPKSKKYNWYSLTLDNVNEADSKLIWDIILSSFMKMQNEESQEVVINV